MKKRFFFALTGAGEPSRDEIGADFDSLDEAYLEACRAALEISFEMLRERNDPSSLKFEITDGQGVLLTDLPFAEVLRPGERLKWPVNMDRPTRSRAASTPCCAGSDADFAELRLCTAGVLASSREVLNRASRQTSILHTG